MGSPPRGSPPGGNPPGGGTPPRLLRTFILKVVSFEHVSPVTRLAASGRTMFGFFLHMVLFKRFRVGTSRLAQGLLGSAESIHIESAIIDVQNHSKSVHGFCPPTRCDNWDSPQSPGPVQCPLKLPNGYRDSPGRPQVFFGDFFL